MSIEELLFNDEIAEERAKNFDKFVESGKHDELLQSIHQMLGLVSSFPIREALSDPGAAEKVCVEKYKSIFRLKDMLDEHNIPYEFVFMPDILGFRLCYPSMDKDLVCSVVETGMSYGHENDLLEILGLLTYEEKRMDDVVGHLTAEDVFQRIKSHYDNIHDIGEEG